jgi:hypothetical protein
LEACKNTTKICTTKIELSGDFFILGIPNNQGVRNTLEKSAHLLQNSPSTTVENPFYHEFGWFRGRWKNIFYLVLAPNGGNMEVFGF